jgi:hypothetical protein
MRTEEKRTTVSHFNYFNSNGGVTHHITLLILSTAANSVDALCHTKQLPSDICNSLHEIVNDQLRLWKQCDEIPTHSEMSRLFVKFLTLCLAFSLLFDDHSTILAVKETTCPCTDPADAKPIKPEARDQHTLCIDDTAIARKLFAKLSQRSLNLNYRLLEDDFEDQEEITGSSEKFTATGCDVMMKIALSSAVPSAKNERCPGVCKAIPFVLVPSSFISSVLNSTPSHFPLCTGNVATKFDDLKKSDGHISLGLVLRAIAIRRLQECEENKNPLNGTWDYVPSITNNLTNVTNAIIRHPENNLVLILEPKRAVYGVIVWIASLTRLKLAQTQASVLRLQDRAFDDSKRIVGWVATEDVYPCYVWNKYCVPQGTTLQMAHYVKHMPRTINHMRSTAQGWTCAQRRPLRAVAHVTRLYDPDFLLLVDDDTFVNLKILQYGSVLSDYILSTMRMTQVVMGDMRTIMTTTKGFYYGGGGYLMGRSVLGNLSSTVITGRAAEDADSIRSAEQIKKLSVLREAKENSQRHCPNCVNVRKLKGLNSTLKYETADLQLRVVDLCVNMMANPGTCYHSDHSMTRCLAHAIYADTMSAGCKGMVINGNGGKTFNVSMCYDEAGCDALQSLTCHRHMADPTNPALPPLLTKKP